MNILDIIILICFIPAIINGLRKGLISQVVSVIALVLGVWLSFKFASVVSGWMGQWFDGASPAILDIVSFTVILIVVIFALFALGKLIEASVKIVMLGWLNKLLGVVFAMLKCLLILGLAVLLFNTLNRNFHIVSEGTLAKSVLYPYLESLADNVFPYLNNLFFN